VSEDVEPLASIPAEASPSSAIQAPDPGDWSDPLTGTDGPRLWDRVLASEVARVRRYRRPATIALAEIVRLDACVAVWGTEIAERAFVRLARILATEVRSSDHIARIERTRFAILLTETDEIAAINFIERVRAAVERQPGEMGIAIGWAGPTGAFDLHEALATAETRLEAEIAEVTSA
jgi:diguanylate cyclase (GGDEF)-like protein